MLYSARTHQHNSSGFTLMEALISIAIMLTAVVAAMSLTTQSIKMISVTRERMVASMLARESIEEIRNRRDRNFLELLKDSSDGTNSNFGGWMAGLRMPQVYGGDIPCSGSDFTNGKGCVAQVDPVPIGKPSEALITFHKCNVDDMSNDSRCWVLTNGGESLNSADREDICDDVSAQEKPACISNLPAEYKYLYRQLKHNAGGLTGRTQYRRMSTVEVRSPATCDEMVVVTTQVVWSGRFGPRKVLVEDHLYNWVGRGILGITDDRCLP